jgi:cell division protein ZapA
MPELSITVKISERPYRLKINTDEEENVRKAVSSLNEKINKYAEVYAYKDRQDLLAMVALQYATTSMSYEATSKVNDIKAVSKLREMDEIITECLNKA